MDIKKLIILSWTLILYGGSYNANLQIPGFTTYQNCANASKHFFEYQNNTERETYKFRASACLEVK